MRQTLIDLFTSKKFLTALTAIVVYVAGRFGFDVDTAVLDRIYAALLVYIGAQGIADHGKGAAQVWAATSPPPPAGLDPSLPITTKPTSPIATVASLALALVVLGFGAAMMLPSCATLRSAAPAAKTAVTDCVRADQAPIEQLLVDLFRAALARAQSGEPVDWEALADQAAAQGATVGGCAFVQLVHGSAPASPSSSSAALAQADPALAALERLRAAVGGARWSTSVGVW